MNNNRDVNQTPSVNPLEQEVLVHAGFNWLSHDVVNLGALNQSDGWEAIQEAAKRKDGIAITFQNNWD